MGESSLTQEDKLRALGIRQPNQSIDLDAELFDEIAEAYEEAFNDFLDDVDGLDSFEEFEDFLVDEDILSAEDAEQLRTRLESRFEEFGEFEDDLNTYESFDEWFNDFNAGETLTGGTKDEDGTVNQGIKFHEQDGVSRAGVPVPAGTVEVYGPRVEFSQTDPAIEDPDASLLTQNLTVSNTTPTRFETVTYSADITNTSGYSTSFSIRLYEDDSRVASKSVSFRVNETKTVEFERSYEEYDSFDVRINDSDEETVVVIHPGIVQ